VSWADMKLKNVKNRDEEGVELSTEELMRNEGKKYWKSFFCAACLK